MEEERGPWERGWTQQLRLKFPYHYLLTLLGREKKRETGDLSLFSSLGPSLGRSLKPEIVSPRDLIVNSNGT